MYKRVIAVILICVGLGLGVYFAYFHRPPTADILAANQARTRMRQGRHPAAEDKQDDDDDSTDDDEEGGDDSAAESIELWDTWIEQNGYVSIGELYNNCNGTDRIMVGRVIMLPDSKNGGVTSKTYLNATFDKPVTDGQMSLSCQYNGKELYSNHWPLCTVEDNEPDRVIFCPIKAGPQRFVKELKIPNYLPKGRYTTTATITDQDEVQIGCGIADFTI